VLSNRVLPDRMTRLQHLHDAGELYHIPFFDWQRARRAMASKLSLQMTCRELSTVYGLSRYLRSSSGGATASASAAVPGCGAAATAASSIISASAAGVADMDVDAEVAVFPGALEPDFLQLIVLSRIAHTA